MAGVCTGPGPCDTSPVGTPGGRQNWVDKAGGLADYVRAIVHALRRKDPALSESEAIQRAWGIIRNWAEGKGGVTPATRARAAAAVAEMDRKRLQGRGLSVTDAATIDLAWTESLHPRNKGKFAPKGSRTVPGQGRQPSSDLPGEVRAQIRDFQRREHLPVTGVFDAATKSRIGSLTNPASGKAAKKAASAAKKAARAKAVAARKAARKQAALTRHQQALARASRARTAAAVNRLSPSQRAAYRKRQPTPPVGYTWTADNHLRATGTTTEAQRVAALAGAKTATTTSTTKPLPFVPGAVRRLSNEPNVVDLAFSPAEARGPDGEWIRISKGSHVKRVGHYEAQVADTTQHAGEVRYTVGDRRTNRTVTVGTASTVHDAKTQADRALAVVSGVPTVIDRSPAAERKRIAREALRAQLTAMRSHAQPVRLANEESAVRVIELNGRRYGVIELVTTVVDTNDFPTLSVPALVRQGKALKPLPGTNRPRFPIQNHDDLKKAVRAVGRAKGDHTQVRRHIIRRAKAIGGTHLIPDHWRADGTTA